MSEVEKQKPGPKSGFKPRKIADVDEDIAKLSGKVDELGENVNTKFDTIMRSLQAQHNPASIRHGETVGEEQESVVSFDAQNRQSGQLIEPQPATTEISKSKADILAFMEEMVTVYIHDTQEEDAQMVFDVTVSGKRANGRVATTQVVFMRGETKLVPRFIIDRLMRLRPYKYSNRKVRRHEEDGGNQYEYPMSSGPRFPFDIVEDTPRGRTWYDAEKERLKTRRVA